MVKLGDFSLGVDSVDLSQPETQLPWIKNLDERRSFSTEGTQALVIRYSVRNDSPVKATRDVWFTVHTTDGKTASWGPYNAELYRTEHKLPEAQRQLSPGQWTDTVAVVTTQPGAADGAAAWLTRKEEQVDPSDSRGRRKIDVLVEQAIIDLGTPTPRPHINPNKR